MTPTLSHRRERRVLRYAFKWVTFPKCFAGGDRTLKKEDKEPPWAWASPTDSIIPGTTGPCSGSVSCPLLDHQDAPSILTVPFRFERQLVLPRFSSLMA